MITVRESGNSYNVNPVSLEDSIQLYHNKGMTELQAGKRQYAVSQYHRSLSLLHYKNCGENLHNIKQLLRSATRKDPAVTSIGTFHCFEQYLDTYYCGENSESGIHKTQAKKYLFLYQNWDVVSQLGLDKPEACYRLNITVRIISWGKKKREEGVDLATLDHHLFFEEKSAEKVDSGKQYDVAHLRAELEYYKSKLDRILHVHPELADF